MEVGTQLVCGIRERFIRRGLSASHSSSGEFLNSHVIGYEYHHTDNFDAVNQKPTFERTHAELVVGPQQSSSTFGLNQRGSHAVITLAGMCRPPSLHQSCGHAPHPGTVDDWNGTGIERFLTQLPFYRFPKLSCASACNYIHTGNQ